MRNITRTTAALASAAALLAAGCGDDDDEQAVTTPQTGTTAQEVPAPDRTLEALLDAPAQFTDEDVSFTGEVDGATSAPAAFEVIRPEGAEQGITVLPTETARNARSVVTNDIVTVEGTVMKLSPDLADRADFMFETDRNASDTLDRVESEYVVAADRVTVR